MKHPFLLVLMAATPLAAQKYTIAYASFAPLNAEVFIANADGSNARPLAPDPGLDCNASFSRDGQWVVFTSDRAGSADIYRVHPDGTGLERLTDDPAFDDQAAFSPDGRSVAFVSTRSGHAEIWLLDLATRAVKNLTRNPAGNFRPAWSPDGQWIAFSSDRDLPPPRRPGSFETLHSTEIYVMKRDGFEVRRVTHTGAFAGSPQFSSDGKQIVFYEMSLENVADISDARHMRATSQIVTIDLATGRERTLTPGDGEKLSPRWLASGIAYLSGGPQGGLEFIGARAGARGVYESPAWSADGKRMVFQRDVSTDWPPVKPAYSRDPMFRLVRTGIFPSYDPSGKRLISGSGTRAMAHNGLIQTNSDGTGRRVLYEDPDKSVIAAIFSPRGDKIALGLGSFFNNTHGIVNAASNLALLNAGGAGLKTLTRGQGNDGFPSWSPDGKELVYRTSSGAGKGLRIITIATGKIRELTNGKSNDNFPSWSPDGKTIAFTSDRAGDYEIYSIHPDGTGLKRLTHSPGNDAHSAWSPDGQWIAFASGRAGFKDEAPLHQANPQSYGEIFVMHPDGSDVRMLTDNPFEDATPAWAPPDALALPNFGSKLH